VLQRPQAAFTVSPTLLYTEDAFINLTNLATNYQTGQYDFGNGIVYNINTEVYNYGIADSGNYVITQVVYNQFGCADTAYAYIHINLSPTLYVPNAFTPDLDGENDGWIPVATGLSEIEVSVFNRWGEEVFVTKDLSTKWYGTYHGKDCPVGVYSWKIVARDINAELIVKSGHITLLR
jgi:gliding motility-associated-like protein